MSGPDLGAAISSALHLQPERTRGDRFMRRLLRLGDVVDKAAIFGARRSTTMAIVVSGVRCTITYLLIPLLAPFVALIETFGAPISVALSLFAMAMGIGGVRRFWSADHRARWYYTTFIGVILVMLGVAIVMDVTAIVGA